MSNYCFSLSPENLNVQTVEMSAFVLTGNEGIFYRNREYTFVFDLENSTFAVSSDNNERLSDDEIAMKCYVEAIKNLLECDLPNKKLAFVCATGTDACSISVFIGEPAVHLVSIAKSARDVTLNRGLAAVNAYHEICRLIHNKMK